MITIKKWNDWLVESVGASIVSGITEDFESIAYSNSSDWDGSSSIEIDYNEKALHVFYNTEMSIDSPILFREGLNFDYQVEHGPIFSSMKDVLVRLVHEESLAFRVYCGYSSLHSNFHKSEHGGSGKGCIVIWNYYGDSSDCTEIFMLYKDDVDAPLSEDEIESIMDARNMNEELEDDLESWLSEEDLTVLLNSINRDKSETEELDNKVKAKALAIRDAKDAKERLNFEKKTDEDILKSGIIVVLDEVESFKLQNVLLKKGYKFGNVHGYSSSKKPVSLKEINDKRVKEWEGADRDPVLFEYPILWQWDTMHDKTNSYDTYLDTKMVIDPKYKSEPNLTKAVKNSLSYPQNEFTYYYDQFMARFDK